jgi:hypothetical protein
MKVYMCQEVFSDNDPDNISLFKDKEDCLTYIKEEMERHCKEQGCDLDDVEHGLDAWHLETDAVEITLNYQEMEIVGKSNIKFFDDNSLAKDVALTKEEIEFFDKLEWKFHRTSGCSSKSGGTTIITIFDEEIPEMLLHFHVDVGVEGDCLSRYAEGIYNRITGKLEE